MGGSPYYVCCLVGWSRPLGHTPASVSSHPRSCQNLFTCIRSTIPYASMACFHLNPPKCIHQADELLGTASTSDPSVWTKRTGFHARIPTALPGGSWTSIRDSSRVRRRSNKSEEQFEKIEQALDRVNDRTRRGCISTRPKIFTPGGLTPWHRSEWGLGTKSNYCSQLARLSDLVEKYFRPIACVALLENRARQLQDNLHA